MRIRFLAALHLFCCIGFPTSFAAIWPCEIKPERELVITDLAVVESRTEAAAAGGRFTLEMLLKGISRDGSAKTALLDLADAWRPIQADGSSVAGSASLLASVFDCWKRLDHPTGPLPSDADWQPHFENAPFRLLAITNRFDLQRRDADGLPLHAGEGRFVFCLVRANGANPDFMRATVIFEYELLARSEADVLGWAQAWHRLGAMDPASSSAYCAALAELTERFTKAGAAPGKANHSALNQIRTNEIDLNLAGWKLREFRLDPSTGRFFSATTKQTPAEANNTAAKLARFINGHEADILVQKQKVPRNFEGEPFLGFEAVVPSGTANMASRDPVWTAPGVLAPKTRHLFSLNTCNGCHGSEAQTNFTHISPRAAGVAAALSPFLQDVAPVDPAGSLADAGDLREITARQTIMAAVLNGGKPDLFIAPPLHPAAAAAKFTPEVQRLLESRANREH